jgi:uncharacterized membrane protein YgdD (TMEM256/DUF423 family)
MAPMNPRTTVLAAGLFGVSAVIFGAFGAHALRGLLLDRGMAGVWETGVQFHLVHSAALLALAGWWRGQAPSAATRRAAWAARCWTLGITLFSGSLYFLAVGAAPRWIGPITPLGGLSLMAGWVCVIAAAFAPASD